jgi:hypothetical protein
LIAFLIIFILAFGGYLMAVPSIRLYEDIICHHYYNELEGEGHIGFEGQIDEELCKVEEVQKELNILLAGLHFLGALPRRFSCGKEAATRLMVFCSFTDCCSIWVVSR